MHLKWGNGLPPISDCRSGHEKTPLGPRNYTCLHKKEGKGEGERKKRGRRRREKKRRKERRKEKEKEKERERKKDF